MSRFERFIAIDWTGAQGSRHRAIAVAEARATGPPTPLRSGHVWSRAEMLDLLRTLAADRTPALIGFDFSFGFPHADQGSYFPGDPDSPHDARALWAEVATAGAAEPDLAALGHVEHRRRHYWLGAADGPRGPHARLRVVEHRQRPLIAGAPSSVFVLLGAAQCGKASLAGMRLLHALGEAIPVWPFDPLPPSGPVIVEIYCRLFALMGRVRGKIRERITLDAALARLGSPASEKLPETLPDHLGDALISAAGLRAIAGDRALWEPPGLDATRQTEGWTFGVP